MKNHYKIIFYIFLLIFIANTTVLPVSQEPELRTWVQIVPNFKPSFYKTDEAIQIGKNCLIYQHKSGGFPKDYYYPDIISSYAEKRIEKDKKVVKNSYPTIDNYATTTEIIYLSRLYGETNSIWVKDSALNGIEFLLNSQYKNGGFPQESQRDIKKKNYQSGITYNDNAMINVLKLLKKVSEKSYPFEYVDDETAQKAKIAVEKGIDCILKTQIIQNSKLTLWAQQYDKKTLTPTKARAYELPAINAGKESAEILLFLMSLDNPSPQIKKSVESAVEWIKNNKIENTAIKVFKDKNGNYDAKIIYCNTCPSIWAKFYDIRTNKPFFVNRQSEKKYNLKEIPRERRIGYEWYGYYLQEVIDTYKTWKYRQKK